MLFSEEFVAGRVNAREAAGRVRERELLRAMRERRAVLAAESAAATRAATGSATRAERPVAAGSAPLAVDGPGAAFVGAPAAPVSVSEEASRELAAACP